MKLDPNKFKIDESKSNPMVVAMQYPDCPIGEICMYMVVGFGTSVRQCDHIKAHPDRTECLYEEVKKCMI